MRCKCGAGTPARVVKLSCHPERSETIVKRSREPALSEAEGDTCVLLSCRQHIHQGEDEHLPNSPRFSLDPQRVLSALCG